MSGPYDDLSGSGILTGIVAKVREILEEPVDSSKYANARILDYLRDAQMEVMREINAFNGFKVHCRSNITITADAEYLAIPPVVGKLIALEKMSTSTPATPNWEIVPSHILEPEGMGIGLEGPVIQIDPTWEETHTLRMTYIHSGEAWPHEGTAPAGDHDDCTITFPAAPTAGTLDLRANAYAGYVLRLLDADLQGGEYAIQEERIITAYEPTTRVATYAPAFTNEPNYDGAAVTYEVVPLHTMKLNYVMACRTALMLVRHSPDAERAAGILEEYRMSMRNLKLAYSQAQGRSGTTMKRGLGRRGRGVC